MTERGERSDRATQLVAASQPYVTSTETPCSFLEHRLNTVADLVREYMG